MNEDTRNLRSDLKNMEINNIIAKLDESRTELQIAIENLDHDFNIGSIVRTANAFNVKAIHIIGSRRWNKRGAMKTDTYMHIFHHYSIEEFTAWANNDTELQISMRNKAIETDPRLRDHTNEIAPKSLNHVQIIAIDCIDNLSTPLEKETLPKNVILMFGSEQNGLSQKALELAKNSTNKILHITQYGSTRSINAGHAAAISMHYWVLQNIKNT